MNMKVCFQSPITTGEKYHWVKRMLNRTLILCIANVCGLDAQICIASLTREFVLRKLAVIEYIIK